MVALHRTHIYTNTVIFLFQDNDVGSETGSESEYQTARSDLDIINKKDETVEIDEMEYDSDNSVDLLQPTQVCMLSKTMLQTCYNQLRFVCCLRQCCRFVTTNTGLYVV